MDRSVGFSGHHPLGSEFSFSCGGAGGRHSNSRFDRIINGMADLLRVSRKGGPRVEVCGPFEIAWYTNCDLALNAVNSERSLGISSSVVTDQIPKSTAQQNPPWLDGALLLAVAERHRRP